MTRSKIKYSALESSSTRKNQSSSFRFCAAVAPHLDVVGVDSEEVVVAAEASALQVAAGDVFSASSSDLPPLHQPVPPLLLILPSVVAVAVPSSST